MLRLWELQKFKCCAFTCVNVLLLNRLVAFFILVDSFNLKLNLIVLTLSCSPTVTVRRDVQENDEEAVRVKEQSILELGTLLAKTGQAAGKLSLADARTHPDERLCLVQNSEKSLFATSLRVVS